VTDTDWDQLAALAQAATPGPWEARREDSDQVIVVHDREYVSEIADIGVAGMPRVEEDAEFIAAANPQTILRLIYEVQRWKAAWEMASPLLTERDALAARLAAVRETFTAWEEEGLGDVPNLHRTNWPDAWVNLRNALDGGNQ